MFTILINNIPNLCINIVYFTKNRIIKAFNNRINWIFILLLIIILYTLRYKAYTEIKAKIQNNNLY